MEMNDNIKAAVILRQYAGELYQGHTIGGRWPEESAHIEREHDELMALADRLDSQPQERGEAVAWVRCHPDGTLTTEFLADAAIEPVRRNSKAWIPLYLHPTPDAGRVAELEAEVAASDRHGVYLEELTDAQVDRIATLESQLAETNKAYRSMVDANRTASERLAESREREGRMREALAERLKNAEQAAFEAWFYKECPSGDASAVQDKWLESDARADALDGWATAEAALAADKEQTK